MANRELLCLALRSWRVGRKRIPFTSTSSGWLIAKATAPRERVGGNRELVVELANALGECLAATVGQLVCE